MCWFMHLAVNRGLVVVELREASTTCQVATEVRRAWVEVCEQTTKGCNLKAGIVSCDTRAFSGKTLPRQQPWNGQATWVQSDLEYA